MSLHTLSDLAVLDITDDSAATHNGGVNITYYDRETNKQKHDQIGGLSHGITRFRHFGAKWQDRIDQIRLHGMKPGSKYIMHLFTGAGATGHSAKLTFYPGNNGHFRQIGNMVNRVKSISLTRKPS